MHPSEIELDSINYDYFIDSSGTIEDSYKEIMKILEEVAEK